MPLHNCNKEDAWIPFSKYDLISAANKIKNVLVLQGRVLLGTCGCAV